ncbi:MAG: saccharopine dehydrogenase NADP-binding domain-containing protein [Bacteroidales bacterium]|nr:saccharopine dehydrogenase NADP-binding domain-containing protein [Bacteroidales bacterium]MCF8391408.1 saccharopine dehydrogenase NADP-binding domain-containing protein [Bacteroidales bacterium]
MKKNIVVLGAGLVGNAMAIDLHKSGHIVTTVDLDSVRLNFLEKKYGIKTINESFTHSESLKEIIKDADIVIGAAPGKYGFQVMKSVIEAGKNMVDISFCPEDFMELNDLAKEKGVTIIADIGVAPGMCNVILGYHDTQMEVNSYKCIVGGLPVKREWPLEYKASWSPVDVIEEYTRPARFKANGQIITKPALSDTELVDLNPVGTLEEWNSDGLRSLLNTMPHIPNLLEKTLRYPGTVEYLKVLRELGYFSEEEIVVNGNKIRPVDLTAELLFPRWKLEKGEKEFTIMQVVIEGMQKGKPAKYIYDLYDEYNAESDTFSMARTTGYTCTGAAELVLNGSFTEKGVNPPEFLGRKEDNFKFLLKHLKERGVVYRKEIL